MNGKQIRDARGTLGFAWGLGRPLRASEFGRVLRLQGRDPGRSVLDWESGKAPVSGPVSVAVELMLGGATIETIEQAIAAIKGE